MSPITVVCPRCSSEYHVPDTKAGKHGRCPKCGALMHVPLHEDGPPPPHVEYSVPLSRRERRLLLWVPVGVLLLATAGYLGHRYMVARAEERQRMIRESPQADAVRQAQREVRRLNDLQSRLDDYRVMAAQENRLRARQIRQRDYARERVTPYEYQLRNEVVESRARFERENPAAAKLEDWKLNEPLRPEEAERLAALTGQVGTEAAGISEALQRVKIDAHLTTDALGRTFIDGEAAATQLEAMRKEAVARHEQARLAYQAMGGTD